MTELEKKYKKETGNVIAVSVSGHPYVEWLENKLEQRLEAGQHETIVMPPLFVKAKRTMPIEMVKREEYEEIKAFYKDVYHLLGSMNYNPDAKNVNGLLKRAKEFVEKHQY